MSGQPQQNQENISHVASSPSTHSISTILDLLVKYLEVLTKSFLIQPIEPHQNFRQILLSAYLMNQDVCIVMDDTYKTKFTYQINFFKANLMNIDLTDYDYAISLHKALGFLLFKTQRLTSKTAWDEVGRELERTVKALPPTFRASLP